jgi:hypothetical protein
VARYFAEKFKTEMEQMETEQKSKAPTEPKPPSSEATKIADKLASTLLTTLIGRTFNPWNEAEERIDMLKSDFTILTDLAKKYQDKRKGEG